MLFILITLLALGLILFLVRDALSDRSYGFIFPSVMFIGSIWFLLFVLLEAVGTTCRVEDRRWNEDYPIYSLQTTQNVSGSFFLGSGYISENAKYYMYSKTATGGYIITSTDVDSTEIHEDVTAENAFRRAKYVQFKHNWFFFPFYKPAGFWLNHELHIPKGSIIQQFNPNIR